MMEAFLPYFRLMVREATVTSSPRPSPRTTPTPWTASTCHPTAQTRRPARYPCVVSQRPAGLAVSRRDQQALLFPAETSRLCCFPQKQAGFAVSRHRDQQALLCPAETSRLCCQLQLYCILTRIPARCWSIVLQGPAGIAVNCNYCTLTRRPSRYCCIVSQRPAGIAVNCNSCTLIRRPARL